MDDVTDASFDDEVIAAEGTVVVDFWAPWCGPCRAIAPILEQLATEFPAARFVKLDIDDNPVVASRFDVLSIPTVMVFSGGSPRETVVGARSADHFRRALDPHL